ncbi:MAG: endolytic transglycosylase MltG [Armatimonadota bacterium]
MKNKRNILVVAAFAFILWTFMIMFVPRGGSGKITVNIPKGSTAGDIGQILAEKGVIRSAFGFKILVRIKHSSSNLKPGAYNLDPSMPPSAVIDKISRGDSVSKWLSIPEGYTIRQIADRIEEEGFGNSSRFYSLAKFQGKSFQTAFSNPGESLEGYLFPDTYLVPIGMSEADIIREMLGCFDRKANKPLADEIRASGMSLHDIVVTASLIEREARVPEDRPLISAVLRNRLKQNMRLGIDATVLYALGKHKDRVLYSDLDVDSPYNTYRNFGLPPGPIANPGIESMKAAIHPADADYVYYVAKPDGSHVFTSTFEEHKQAIADIKAKAGG